MLSPMPIVVLVFSICLNLLGFADQNLRVDLRASAGLRHPAERGDVLGYFG